MSKYIVTLSPGEVIYDGLTKYIKCPCDCYGVTDVILNNPAGDVIGTFSLCDATGKTTSDVGNVWSAGHYIQIRFDFSAMKAQVLNGASSKHASQHGADGLDPITPGMIGAAEAEHSHQPSEVGAAPSIHSHSANDITAGTFGGQVVANADGQTPGTYLVRNQKLSATAETPTVNGEICWVYK